MSSFKTSDKSPERSLRHSMLKGGEARGPIQSSFQRNEALVFTDDSNKFPEWPAESRSKAGNKHVWYNPSTRQQSKDLPQSLSLINTDSVESRQNQTKYSEMKQSLTQKGTTKFRKEILAKLNSSTLQNSIAVSINAISRDDDLVDTEEREQMLSSDIISKLPSFNNFNSKSDCTTHNDVPTSSIAKHNEIRCENNTLDAFLRKAEMLLADVKSATGKCDKYSEDKIPSKINHSFSSSGLPEDRLSTGNAQSFPSFNFPNGGQHASQIEWLIRGVPEALEDLDNPVIDDLVVERLLSEGGHAPSQLVFPSLYAANQRVMARLRHCNQISIDVSQLSIFSSKYCIRRDSSFLVIRPPLMGISSSAVPIAASTANIEASTSFTSSLPLSELKETIAQVIVAKSAERNNQKDSSFSRLKKSSAASSAPAAFNGRQYFVGSVSLDKKITYSVDISDEVAREWFNGANDKGILRIELHSNLYASDVVARRQDVAKAMDRNADRNYESICFAFVDIPMSGLLTSESLEATATCQLTAEASTLATVINKINALPNGIQLLRANPLGPAMGAITVQMNLSDKSGKKVKLGENIVYPGHKTAPSIDRILGPTRQDQIIESAARMEQIENQARIFQPNDFTAMMNVKRKHRQPVNANHSATILSGLSEMQPSSDVYIGLIFYNIEVFSAWVESELIGHEAFGHSFVIKYKLSPRVCDQIVAPVVLRSTTAGVMVLNINCSKVYPMNRKRFTVPPEIEIWISEPLLGDASPTGPQVARKNSKLLATLKIPEYRSFGDTISMPICSNESNQSIGIINFAFCQHDTCEDASRIATKLLTAFNVSGDHGATLDIPSNSLPSSAIITLTDTSQLPNQPSHILSDLQNIDGELCVDKLRFEEVANTSTNQNDDMQEQEDKSLIQEEPRTFNMVPIPEKLSPRFAIASKVHDVSDSESPGEESSQSDIDVSNSNGSIFFLTSPSKTKLVQASEFNAGDKVIDLTGAGSIVNSLTSPPTSFKQESMIHGDSYIIPESSALASSTCVTNHILDIIIEGSCKCNPVNSRDENRTIANPLIQLGAFVIYNIPSCSEPIDQARKVVLNPLVNFRNDNRQPSETDSRYFLWWDSDCTILNGRNTHKIEISSSTPNSQSVMNPDLLMQQMGLPHDGITFTLLHDVNVEMDHAQNGFSLPPGNIFATAILSSESIAELFSMPGCHRTFRLPLMYTSGKSEAYIVDFMTLSISHTIEPMLLTNVASVSRQNLFVDKDFNDTATKVENIVSLNKQSLNSPFHRLDNDDSSDMMSEKEKSIPKRKSIPIYVCVEKVTQLRSSRFLSSSESMSHAHSLILTNTKLFMTGSVGSLLQVSAGGMLTDKLLHVPATDSFVSTAHDVPSDEDYGRQAENWMETNLCHVNLIPIVSNDSEHADSTDVAHNVKRYLRDKAVTLSLYARKLWNATDRRDISGSQLQLGDQLVGTAIVDISTLGLGMPFIEGWYHLMDPLQNSQGLVKIKINCSEDISTFTLNREQSKNEILTRNLDEEAIQICNDDSTAEASLLTIERSNEIDRLNIVQERVGFQDDCDYRHPSFEALKTSLLELERGLNFKAFNKSDKFASFAEVETNDSKVIDECFSFRSDESAMVYADHISCENDSIHEISINSQPTVVTDAHHSDEQSINESECYHPVSHIDCSQKSQTFEDVWPSFQSIAVLRDHYIGDEDMEDLEVKGEDEFSNSLEHFDRESILDEALGNNTREGELIAPIITTFDNSVQEALVSNPDDTRDHEVSESSVAEEISAVDSSLEEYHQSSDHSEVNAPIENTEEIRDGKFSDISKILTESRDRDVLADDYQQFYSTDEDSIDKMDQLESLSIEHRAILQEEVNGGEQLSLPSLPNYPEQPLEFSTSVTIIEDNCNPLLMEEAEEIEIIEVPEVSVIFPEVIASLSHAIVEEGENSILDPPIDFIEALNDSSSSSSFGLIVKTSIQVLPNAIETQVNNSLEDTAASFIIDALVDSGMTPEAMVFEEPDSPDTIKIKRIATEVIDLRLPVIEMSSLKRTNDVQSAPSPPKSNVRATATAGRDTCIGAVDIRFSVPPVPNAITINNATRISEVQVPRGSVNELSRIADLIPSLIPPPSYKGKLTRRIAPGSNLNTSAVNGQPGFDLKWNLNQRQFLDAETERVSKIMLGKLERVYE